MEAWETRAKYEKLCVTLDKSNNSERNAILGLFRGICNELNSMIDEFNSGGGKTEDELYQDILSSRNAYIAEFTGGSTESLAVEVAYNEVLRNRGLTPPTATPPQLLRPTTKVAGTEPAPDVKAPTVSKTDPVKETIKWLKNTDRQYIIKYTEPETAVMLSGALSHIKPPVSEWRIAKPAAFIYRELMNAAENSIISLGKNAIADFMINNLKKKDGKDITIDSLIKAKERTKSDKSRQIPTK